uniref:protocadherin-10-like n=1 Tax=Myxine glutinosa TaxID=7769 RepID=UPI00358F0402
MTASRLASLLTLYLCGLLCTAGPVRAAAARASQLRYSMHEEESSGVLVGNLAMDLGLSPAEMKARHFRSLPGNNASAFLSVDPQTSELRIRDKIDRESVCPRATGTGSCVLMLEAVLDQPLQLVRVHFDILDINDHAPFFPADSTLLEITESAAVGTRFLLEGASDPDAGANSLRGYSLSPDDGLFSLDVQAAAGGIRAPELVVRRPMDRELQALHRYVLTATDGAKPPRTGTTMLTIRVLDSNDNAPTFDRSVYTARVRENAPVGTTVLQLNATDPDEGANGEVVYALGSHVSPRVRQLFQVDPRSGKTSLRGVLDYEEASSYEIYVQARDRGPNSIPVHGEVLVQVLDVNDNAPNIHVLTLAQNGESYISVSEGATPGAFVAFVRITDKDSGANGRVACTLEGPGLRGERPPFALRTSEGGEDYTLVTAGPLDRESMSEYNLTVLVRDGGVPPLVSAKTFTVRLRDENDNSPHFLRSLYEFHVSENNIPGAYLGSVSALDQDVGENARIAYSIVDSQIDGMSVFTYVSINPASGALYALRAFDYEHAHRMDFHVQAQDNGTPPLRGDAAVALIVGDTNDEVPTIVQPSLDVNDTADVYIAPGSPAGALVATVRATDGDEGENAQLTFGLTQSEEPALFRISANSGELRTTGVLPFGEANHELILLVNDHGEPQLTATAIIRVLVTAAPRRGSARGVTGYEDVGRASDGAFTTSFIVIIALGAVSCVLLIAMVLIAVRCKRENKEMRTYNCRAAAETSGQPSPRKADATLAHGELDMTTKAAPDADYASVISLHTYEYQSFLPSESSGGASRSEETPTEQHSLYCKATTPYPAVPPRRPLPCHALNGAPRQPDLLLGGFPPAPAQRPRYFLEPTNQPTRQQSRSHTFKEADRLSFKDSGHGDSDPGDSDQDTTRGSYNEMVGRDAAIAQQLAEDPGAVMPDDQGEGDVHSNCTPDCKVLGHSDRCWMPAFASTEARPCIAPCREAVLLSTSPVGAVDRGCGASGATPNRCDFPRRTFSTFGKDDMDTSVATNTGANLINNTGGGYSADWPQLGSRPSTLRFSPAVSTAGVQSSPRHADSAGKAAFPADGSSGSPAQEGSNPVPSLLSCSPSQTHNLPLSSSMSFPRRLAPIPEPAFSELEEGEADEVSASPVIVQPCRKIREVLDATQVVAEIEQLLRDSAS